MKRNLKFNLDITIDVPNDYSTEDTIDAIIEMMNNDGISEYINKDNLISEL